MHTFAKNILDVEIEVGRTVIWRAKDGDYPVTIAGDLGVSPGGRRYVSVESSSASHKAAEI